MVFGPFSSRRIRSFSASIAPRPASSISMTRDRMSISVITRERAGASRHRDSSIHSSSFLQPRYRTNLPHASSAQETRHARAAPGDDDMSLRAREGLPEHTHMMTPSQLHTHLHHEAYKDIEDRFANADSRRSKLLEATRSVSVERAKKVRAMLERVDHLRAGKPVDVSGFSRRPQEVLDTLNEAGQMPAAAYAREMRRADAAEATFARRTEEQRTLRPEDKKLKSHYFLDREQKIKSEKVTGTVRRPTLSRAARRDTRSRASRLLILAPTDLSRPARSCVSRRRIIQGGSTRAGFRA